MSPQRQYRSNGKPGSGSSVDEQEFISVLSGSSDRTLKRPLCHAYIGASGGSGWYVGADLVSFDDASDPEMEINGVQIAGGFGVGVDIHVTETETATVGGRAKSRASEIINKYAPSVTYL